MEDGLLSSGPIWQSTVFAKFFFLKIHAHTGHLFFFLVNTQKKLMCNKVRSARVGRR